MLINDLRFAQPPDAYCVGYTMDACSVYVSIWCDTLKIGRDWVVLWTIDRTLCSLIRFIIYIDPIDCIWAPPSVSGKSLCPSAWSTWDRSLFSRGWWFVIYQFYWAFSIETQWRFLLILHWFIPTVHIPRGNLAHYEQTSIVDNKTIYQSRADIDCVSSHCLCSRPRRYSISSTTRTASRITRIVNGRDYVDVDNQRFDQPN